MFNNSRGEDILRIKDHNVISELTRLKGNIFNEKEYTMHALLSGIMKKIIEVIFKYLFCSFFFYVFDIYWINI